MDFSSLFYRALLSQYFGFLKRRTDFVLDDLSFEELEEEAEGDAVLLRDIRKMQSLQERKHPVLAWDFARRAGHRIASNKGVYILQIIDEFQYLDNMEELDLTTCEGVRAAFEYETGKRGCITKMWMEYVLEAFERVNGKDTLKSVLYLTKYGDEERSREQILIDLQLDRIAGPLA